MASWSYVGTAGGDGDDDSAAPWMLFARRVGEGGECAGFAFTAVVTTQQRKEAGPTDAAQSRRHVVAELRVDAAGLRDHIEELGVEVDTPAFERLLMKALGERQCVDLRLEGEPPANVALELTYNFSASVSRRGCFQLPIVATDAPEAMITLLSDLHASPNRPVVSVQELQRPKKRHLDGNSTSLTDSKTKATPSTQPGQSASTNGNGSASLRQNDAKPTAKTPCPMAAKRRHLLPGAMRRKGPRGAKLAKN